MCIRDSYSKHQNKILELNVKDKYVWVEPGVVLDHLNEYLKPYGLWFPVDVSTSSRATIGGMSANNSCGSRSLYYGNMVHNVLAIEAILDDGSIFTFDQIEKNYLERKNNQDRLYKIIDKFIDVRQKVAGDIKDNWPTTQRRVGGYNIDLIDPNGFNSSNLLVGSEGTLSLFNKIKLKLSEIPKNKILGVCYFNNFHQAMELAKEIVRLKPTCVELMDQNLFFDLPLLCTCGSACIFIEHRYRLMFVSYLKIFIQPDFHACSIPCTLHNCFNVQLSMNNKKSSTHHGVLPGQWTV